MKKLTDEGGLVVVPRRIGLRAMLLGLPVALAMGGCGAPLETDDQKPDEPLSASQSEIKNGTNATDVDLFPLVTVTVHGRRGRCTGTIISHRHILTARHCQMRPGDVVVYFKDDSPSGLEGRVLQVYSDQLAGSFDNP